MVYSHVGLLDEARSHVGHAIDLNPNNTIARFRVGVYAAWQCRFEDALAVLKTEPSDVSPLLSTGSKPPRTTVSPATHISSGIRHSMRCADIRASST
jgi:hypothetical protein